MPGQVHIIAHSLGVRLFWQALKSFPSPVQENRLGHIFWVAGDLSRKRFCDKFDSLQVQLRCQTSTSYYCHSDGALAWSRIRALCDKRLGQGASRLQKNLYNALHTSIKVSCTIACKILNPSIIGADYFGLVNAAEIALEGDPMFSHTYFSSLPLVRDIFQTVVNAFGPADRELQSRIPGVSWALLSPATCESFITPLFKLVDIQNKYATFRSASQRTSH